MSIRRQDKGTVLIIALIFAVIVSAFCMTSLMISTAESRGAHVALLRDKAFFVAQAGLNDEVVSLNALTRGKGIAAIEALAGSTPIERRPLMSGGVAVGEYTVVIESVTAVSSTTHDIAVTSTGFVPSEDHPQAVRRSVTAVLRLAFSRSEVFDYVYFINNWGWYYGDTIIANGNVRANGQFDFGGYRAQVNGVPRFDGLTDGVLGGQVDDGGVYAGWDIINSDKVTGLSGVAKKMYPFSDQIKMPNLTDLTVYENIAKTQSSSITIDGVTICNAVVGDEPSERKNLCLIGTEDAPIVLDGPVVVRGDLIIKGYVQGKGALYVQGNIYVAGDIKYKNPIAKIDGAMDRDKMETWISDNQQADALGLFAREHIVVGDYTDYPWQRYVKTWVIDWRNTSEEDAGEDGIPNTRAGRDGILGTADDDVLEGDDRWTTESYTVEDQQKGLIPEGFNVGDAVPESGEDIDGDGKYDPGAQMSEFNMKDPINSTYWQGNLPSSETISYRTITGTGHQVARLDAAFYTNHTFALLTLAFDKELEINGAVVSRNESIIYGTKLAIFNYDLRLLEENNPHGLILPKTWKPVTLVMWRSD